MAPTGAGTLETDGNTVMNEAEFNALAESTLSAVSSAVEESGLDCDVEMKGDGVIEITLEDDTRLIVNRHAAAREIWVAARSGGYHFRHDGRQWINTRDGGELFASLSRFLSEQSGSAVSLLRA